MTVRRILEVLECMYERMQDFVEWVFDPWYMP